MSQQKTKVKRQKIKSSWLMPFHLSFFTSSPVLKNLCFCTIFLALFSFPAFAQFSTSIGLTIQMVGMVQVEPGGTVITLKIKDTEIRFQVQDVISTNRDFSVPQFLVELQHRSPSMTIQGAESLLDLLLEEKPKKRALKLSGIYYHDARRFMLNKISTLNENNRPQF